MNKIDDILDRLQGSQPLIDNPDELTDRIMSSLPDIDTKPAPHIGSKPKRRVWIYTAAAIAAAASVLLLLIFPLHPGKTADETPKVARRIIKVPRKTIPPKRRKLNHLPPPPMKHLAANQPAKPVAKKKAERKTAVPAADTLYDYKSYAPATQADAQIVYASQHSAPDTAAYQAPDKVDEFITKLANYHGIESVALNCLEHRDSTVVALAYVFPDTREIDLFGRLLQVACCYDDSTPGYLLNFSHRQFFFTLEDRRKGMKYLWIAERIGGDKILLYTTHSPKETYVPSECFRDYRDELTHMKTL